MKRIVGFACLAGGILLLAGCGQPPASTVTSAANWTIEAGTRISGGDLVSPSIIKLSHGNYRLFWGGGNVSSAISSDEGYTFSKESGYRWEEGGNPAILQVSGQTYRMYYEVRTGQDKNQIRSLHSAISSDEGFTWTKEGSVLSPETVDQSFLSVPDAIKLPDGNIRLYYVSAGFFTRSATSSDGRNFSRDQSGSNYILGSSTDYSSVAIDPCIYYEGGVYRLYYSTDWADDNPKKIVSATSSDGINFTKDNLTVAEAGKGNSLIHVVDSAIIKLSSGKYRMFFGGEVAPNQFDLFSTVSDTF